MRMTTPHYISSFLYFSRYPRWFILWEAVRPDGKHNINQNTPGPFLLKDALTLFFFPKDQHGATKEANRRNHWRRVNTKPAYTTQTCLVIHNMDPSALLVCRRLYSSKNNLVSLHKFLNPQKMWVALGMSIGKLTHRRMFWCCILYVWLWII